MKFITGAVAALSLAAVAAPASAQVAMEANGARSEGVWGAELGVGYSVVSFGGFRVTPSVGAFIYRDENDRYDFQDNGGQPRCRDLSDGQYANDELCDDTATKVYGRVEATYSIPLLATVGAGARLMSGEVRPYGTVALPLMPLIQLKANVGEEYYAAGVQVRF